MTGQTELSEETRLFLLESYENLERIEQDLVQLEKCPQDNALLNSVFRAMHTIKGNSGFFDFPSLQSICHKGETLLDRVRGGALVLTPDIVSTLLTLVDSSRGLLEGIESSGVEPTQSHTELEAELQRFLDSSQQG